MLKFRKHSIEEKCRRSKLQKQRKRNKRKYQDTVKQGTVNSKAKGIEKKNKRLKFLEAKSQGNVHAISVLTKEAPVRLQKY